MVSSICDRDWYTEGFPIMVFVTSVTITVSVVVISHSRSPGNMSTRDWNLAQAVVRGLTAF